MLTRALKHPAALLGVALLLTMAALFATPAHAQAAGGLTLNANPGPGGGTSYSVPIQTLLIFSALSFLPSDLPGFTRAVVSRDVMSFDGKTVLIPRGSRLIGQYKSGVAMGASRVFVIWTRVIRPDGVALCGDAPCLL